MMDRVVLSAMAYWTPKVVRFASTSAPPSCTQLLQTASFEATLVEAAIGVTRINVVCHVGMGRRHPFPSSLSSLSSPSPPPVPPPPPAIDRPAPAPDAGIPNLGERMRLEALLQREAVVEGL